MAKVLIVEDDTIAASAFQTLLEAASHQVRVLSNGKNALEIVREFQPDVLLLDVMLPGEICGFEVCRRIRRDPELYTLPILMISAMSHEEEVLHGLSQGADDYLTKPFDNHTLLRRIEMLLEIHSSSDGKDTLTGLPSPDIIRHEIQRRISGREQFAIVCAELTGLRELGRTYGNDARSRVIKKFSRVLTHAGEKLSLSGFFVGHMGGGYFVCLMEMGKAVVFSQMVERYWQECAKQLFGDGKTPGEFFKQAGTADVNIPRVLLCATACESRPCDSPKMLFETLAQLRTKASNSSKSGAFFDQRCACFHA